MSRCEPAPGFRVWYDIPEPGTIRFHSIPGPIRPGRCKKYSCARCGPGKRAEAMKLIAAGVRPGQPHRMLTFTWPLERDLRKHRAADARTANTEVRRLVQELRRQGIGFHYVKAIELTKRGYIHVHALSRGRRIPKCTDAGRQRHGLPIGLGSGSPCYCAAAGVMCRRGAACPDHLHHRRRCVQAIAWHLGMGFVDVRSARNLEHAQRYIGKYLVKASEASWPNHVRRLTYSRRWAPNITLGLFHRMWVAGALYHLEKSGQLEPPPWPILRTEYVGPFRRAPPTPSREARPPTITANGEIRRGHLTAPPLPWPLELLPDPF